MAKKQGKVRDIYVESILDINTSNVWSLEAEEVATLWTRECSKEGFAVKEAKLLNTIRTAFEVAHYDPEDERDKETYENGEWATFPSLTSRDKNVAIRHKQIKRLADLTADNVGSLSVAMLLELIDRNFGSGWSSIAETTRDIIEGAFEISVSKLPTSRMHAKGGTFERKTKEGFEALEIAQGTWTEAIFARKKEPLAPMDDDEGKEDFEEESLLSETGNEPVTDDTDTEGQGTTDSLDEEYNNDEGYYNNYIEEAGMGDEGVTDDGFIIEEGE